MYSRNIDYTKPLGNGHQETVEKIITEKALRPKKVRTFVYQVMAVHYKNVSTSGLAEILNSYFKMKINLFGEPQKVKDCLLDVNKRFFTSTKYRIDTNE